MTDEPTSSEITVGDGPTIGGLPGAATYEEPVATVEEPAAVDDPWAPDATAGAYDPSALAPDGGTLSGNSSGWDDEDGEDLGDLRINFSDDEAAAESLVPLPPGKYIVAITGGKVQRSKSQKNPGKPFYSLTYTVQEGEYAGRKIFDNIMLWAGAAYSLSQLMKALGYPVSKGEVKVPSLAELQNQKFLAQIKIQPERTVDGKVYEPRNEVKGYFNLNVAAKAGAVRGHAVDPLAP